jgi:hypothetical protein
VPLPQIQIAPGTYDLELALLDLRRRSRLLLIAAVTTSSCKQ